MSLPSSSPLPSFSPPWTCHGDFYAIPFYTTPATLPLLTNSFLHAPLEASHESRTSLMTPIGGIGMLQIIRYKDTPAGPYDEMVVIPGSYECVKVEGGKEVKRKGLRITRIYVSQKETCYNGRKHWNIPKHLADFTFTTNPDSSLTLTLKPHDSPSSSKPFFTTTFHPSSPLLPPIPLSLTLLSPLISTTCILPPLPSSPNPAEADFIVGTERWCAFSPRVKSWRSKVGWFDMRQGLEEGVEGEQGEGREENFWPGWGRWRVGLWMKDAVLEFDEPETWASGDAREVKKQR